MKRSTVLLFLMLFVGIITANEQQVMGEIIHLQVRYYDPTLEHEPLKSAPVRIPTIMINDHTLQFQTSLDGCEISLLDADREPVYISMIPNGATSILLPNYLSGDYIIQITRGRLCFWGYIYL